MWPRKKLRILGRKSAGAQANSVVQRVSVNLPASAKWLTRAEKYHLQQARQAGLVRHLPSDLTLRYALQWRQLGTSRRWPCKRQSRRAAPSQEMALQAEAAELYLAGGNGRSS